MRQICGNVQVGMWWGVRQRIRVYRVGMWWGEVEDPGVQSGNVVG